MASLADLAGILKRSLRYRSVETARLIQRNLPNIVAPLRPEGRLIRCDELDLTLDPERDGFFLEGMQYAARLLKTGAGRFEPLPGGGFEFRSEGVRIVPETRQELFILDEIFRAGIYDIQSPQEWLVWDVGANVGIASAYFGGIKGWETVGYEPFPEPYAIAVRAIERSGLGDRVTLRQQGVSDRDETLRLGYNRRSRGSNGLYGNNAVDRSGDEIEVEVAFADAAEVVRELVERARGRPILAKIDCEGAEYAIVRRLRETGLLSALGAVVMEYHLLAPEHSYESLVRDFTESGFLVHGDRASATHVGMLWAIPRSPTRHETPLEPRGPGTESL